MSGDQANCNMGAAKRSSMAHKLLHEPLSERNHGKTETIWALHEHESTSGSWGQILSQHQSGGRPTQGLYSFLFTLSNN